MKQKIYDDFEKFKNELREDLAYRTCLLVCSKSQNRSEVVDWLRRNCGELVQFNDFSSNPKYGEALTGFGIFNENNCDFLISLGGGSAIDVAKVIKAMLGSDNYDELMHDKVVIADFLKNPGFDGDVPHLAIPTTAGTGSESTHFAVIYYEGAKYSVSNDGLLPNYVLLQPELLATLPEYQKKSTMLDALCQGIESYWSVRSTNESKKYAVEAIATIFKDYGDYINLPFDYETAARILKAANLSGQAINISQTTAAHAMSYKITSLYGLAHGHAVAVCLPWVWRYMLEHLNLTIDERGKDYVAEIMGELARLFGVESCDEAIEKMFELYDQIGIEYKHVVKAEDVDALVKSVNLERLGNNPVKLDAEALEWIYRKLV